MGTWLGAWAWGTSQLVSNRTKFTSRLVTQPVSDRTKFRPSLDFELRPVGLAV